MGSLCVIGVDGDLVLKDFIRAHVDYLSGQKVCVDHWYPDYRYEGKIIRYFYSESRARLKLRKLLPQALYHRAVTRHERSEAALQDAFAGFFREHNVDVILAEFGPAGADICRHARALDIPLIVHFHGHDAHRSATIDEYRDRYREMFDYAFGIISVSHYMTRALVALGANESRITYNPYGPRERFFSNEPDYRPTILSLGRFTDIKASHVTLMAFREVMTEFPHARLVMAGGGELLECCKSLAGLWGMAERVDFPGTVPHAAILPLFAEACCFAQHSVVPSYGDAEGTPVVILEAQAAGLPVISTRHAGITDAVVDGATGLLTEEMDVMGMAAHMRTLLSNQELCRTMGTAARAHIRSSYSMERHIARLQSVIDSARKH